MKFITNTIYKPMTHVPAFLAAASIGLAGVAFTPGCSDDSEVGEEMQEIGEEMQEAGEEAVDKVKETGEEIADETEDAADEVEDKLDN